MVKYVYFCVHGIVFYLVVQRLNLKNIIDYNRCFLHVYYSFSKLATTVELITIPFTNKVKLTVKLLKLKNIKMSR